MTRDERIAHLIEAFEKLGRKPLAWTEVDELATIAVDALASEFDAIEETKAALGLKYLDRFEERAKEHNVSVEDANRVLAEEREWHRQTAERLKLMEKQRDAWQEEARLMTVNRDYWRDRTP